MTEPIGKTLSDKKILGGLLGLGLLVLSACGGGSNSSGPPPPLPNGQTGSIEAAETSSPANCYIQDTTTCGTSSSYTGTNPITALAAATVGTPNVLYWGDGGGNIYSYSNPNLPPPSSSFTPCSSTLASSPITSLAVVPSSSAPLLFYTTSGGIYEGTLTAPTGACTSSFSAIHINTSLTGALAYSNGLIVGVTPSATYFTCTPTTSPIACNSQGTLPGLVDISPQITAIGADPQYAIVYVVAIGVNTSRIYFYQVGANGVLTSIGNYTGTELNSPSGIALFVGKTGTSNYCTIGPCTFMDVTNTGNTTVTQYVLTYTIPSTGTPTGVSVNQFNNAYYNCDLINPVAIAAFPLPTSSGALNTPEVFVGENGISSVSSSSLPSCFGLSSGPYGNNITAYIVKNEE